MHLERVSTKGEQALPGVVPALEELTVLKGEGLGYEDAVNLCTVTTLGL